MDALEFVRERNCMYKSFGGKCNGCPADSNTCCNTLEQQEDFVAIVGKWPVEHPRKTRQSEFLKQYPNTELINGVGAICPMKIDISFFVPLVMILIVPIVAVSFGCRKQNDD